MTHSDTGPARATTVASTDRLPLTCTRAGTCCHGKTVWINPWELSSLAHARGLTPRAFRDRFTVDGGIRLRFDGEHRWRGLQACGQYDAARGCVAHAARPLACRLYPLGRELREGRIRYLHDGPRFPCLDGCPEVTGLPPMTVGDYLAAQQIAEGEAASDAYLELAQDLGEGAFVLVFDTGLAERRELGVLARWRETCERAPSARADALGPDLLDLLVAPPLDPAAGPAFVEHHARLMREHAQAAYSGLTAPEALAAASCAMLALALHLARSLGAEDRALGDHWLRVAEGQGLG